jgi:hypothetical protein
VERISGLIGGLRTVLLVRASAGFDGSAVLFED